MISSVTTTVTTVAMLTVGATLGVLASVLLILLLATKNVVAAEPKRPLMLFSRALDVSIMPLLVSFTLIVTLKVIEILA
ncbi:MAG: hypothetical protein RMI99_02840 [Nitrososphaerota archaeon]|nr:hypothetical protein [Candidatus Nezhaarchaeota archaeon]MDW8049998.1 hypothetical protein [Nitrososphaerota archaeon]